YVAKLAITHVKNAGKPETKSLMQNIVFDEKRSSSISSATEPSTIEPAILSALSPPKPPSGGYIKNNAAIPQRIITTKKA
ncbi:hypothetical protein QTN98_24890, partial [Vibrio parahaemolyticus]